MQLHEITDKERDYLKHNHSAIMKYGKDIATEFTKEQKSEWKAHKREQAGVIPAAIGTMLSERYVHNIFMHNFEKTVNQWTSFPPSKQKEDHRQHYPHIKYQKNVIFNYALFGMIAGALLFAVLGALSSHLLINSLIDSGLMEESVFFVVGDGIFHHGLILGLGTGAAIGAITGVLKGYNTSAELSMVEHNGISTAQERMVSLIRDKREQDLSKKVDKFQKLLNHKADKDVSITH